MTISFKDSFKNLGQALGGAVAVGVQRVQVGPRRRAGAPTAAPATSSSGAPRCTPCRANAMVAAAKKFSKG